MEMSWKLTSSLNLVLVAYLTFGAWLFRYLESDQEVVNTRNVQEMYKNLTSMSSDCVNITQLLDYVQQVMGLNDRQMAGETDMVKWDWGGAYFFSFTVVTTIGYGMLAPKTVNGRLAFIFYALFGIPLFLTILNHIAEHSKCLHTKVRAKHEKYYHLYCIGFYIITMAMIFFIPSAVIAWLEGWSYLDSFYYSFQSLTTVGFGDVLPMHAKSSLVYRICLTIWMIVGLAYVSSMMTYLYNIDTKIFMALITCRKIERKCDEKMEEK